MVTRYEQALEALQSPRVARPTAASAGMRAPPPAATPDPESSREREAAARDGALAAARARIKVLEQQLGLSAATAHEARRGVTAIAQSAELAAVRAERDSLQASLEAAERRALLAGRQQRSERERRTALATTLRQREEELGKQEAVKQATQEELAAAEAAQRAAEAVGRELVAAVLGVEMRELEAEAYEGRAALEEQLMGALDRAADAERALTHEMLAVERVTMQEAEQRAMTEASAWQREATLQVRVTAAAEDAHAEARRAAALEAALAAEVEGRQRDARAASAEAEAWRERLLQSEVRSSESREAYERETAERLAAAEMSAAQHASAAASAFAALKESRAAMAKGAHATLLLRLGARGVRSVGLSFALHRWRQGAALSEAAMAAAALKEEVRMLQGRLALARDQRERVEKSASVEAKKAEEEAARRLALAQRKLSAEEERRKILERDVSARAAQVDAVRTELQPYIAQSQQLRLESQASLQIFENELRAADAAAARVARRCRLSLLRAATNARRAGGLSAALVRWSAAAAALAAAEVWERGASEWEHRESEAAAAREAVAEARLTAAMEDVARERGALRVQAAARRRAARAALAAAAVRERQLQVEVWSREAHTSEQLRAAEVAHAEATAKVQRLGAQLAQQTEVLAAARAAAAEAAASLQAETSRAASREHAAAAEALAQREALEEAHAEAARALRRAAGAEQLLEQQRLEQQRRQRSRWGSSDAGTEMDDDGPPAEGGLAPATLVFVVRLAARAARRRQLCCTLRLWRQVAVSMGVEVEALLSASRAAELHGKLASLKERHARGGEAQALADAAVAADERKQLHLLRRKLATETDRRTTLTAELREALLQRNEAMRRELESRTEQQRAEAALEAERSSSGQLLSLVVARAEQLEARAEEADARSAELVEARDAAVRVREVLESRTAFASQTAEAQAHRLATLLERATAECDAFAHAARAHEGSAQRAAAQVLAVGRSLAAAEDTATAERARADAAVRQRNDARREAAQLRAALEVCRREAAHAHAEAAAARRRAAAPLGSAGTQSSTE
jgi:hypothetical protein